ncbi:MULTISPECIES: M48 family metallopeptidase [Sphingomonadales]|uniref:M48 family metallopeptidase n=1 Tax=Sphingomonadales TaxID=204457 RepID=UPI0009EAA31E|nr:MULTISPECIES: SprT family zinc-dependent metalloprotease [Sphingomonadales]
MERLIVIDWLREPRDPMVALAGGDLPLIVRRHPRARRMTLRLADDGEGVQVTLPRWGTTREALAFAQGRADWLDAQRAKRPVRIEPAPGGTLTYRGQDLVIDWHANRPRKVVLGNDAISLGGPRDTLAPRLKRWMQNEARALLAQDLAFYAARAGLAVPDFALSSARRRWGSCSSDGTVRLNWRLVQAPDDVRRSVVAHETAHRVHFDHSPRFHALLGELFEGDLPAAESWLKAHGRALFSAFG